jgi:hypothetical protein
MSACGIFGADRGTAGPSDSPQGEIFAGRADQIVAYAALAMPGIMPVRWIIFGVKSKQPLEGK